MKEEKKPVFLKESKKWLNTPWMHNQAKIGIGVDCVQFLKEVAKASGYDLPEIPFNYSRLPKKNQIEEYLQLNLKKKEGLEFDTGDILLFGVGNLLGHVALAIDNKSIIHASIIHKRVIMHILDGPLKRQLNSVWGVD